MRIIIAMAIIGPLLNMYRTFIVSLSTIEHLSMVYWTCSEHLL